MESIFSFICEHANHAPWIIFILLLLSGLCLPISEDILLIGGGALASTCAPNHTLRMYLWFFLGSGLAGWEAYWLGRLVGPRVHTIPLIKRIMTTQRLEKLKDYYAKFGVFSFIIGRFCPGGIRNSLFITCGITKMPFHLFILRDGFACLLSTSLLFSIGYAFGTHLDTVLYYLKWYSEWFIATMAVLLLSFSGYYWYTHKKNL